MVDKGCVHSCDCKYSMSNLRFKPSSSVNSLRLCTKAVASTKQSGSLILWRCLNLMVS